MVGDRGNNSNWKLSLAYATHTVPFSPNSRLVLAVYRSYTMPALHIRKREVKRGRGGRGWREREKESGEKRETKRVTEKMRVSKADHK